MTTDDIRQVSDPKKCPVDFARHAAGYRERFEEITEELHSKCPIAWSDDYDGHWVVSGMQELFDIARRADALSNDNDVEGVKQGYRGISIPTAVKELNRARGGFLEMDPPEQQDYRKALNPYLSPAAIARWQPVADEMIRACIDDRIETGSIDFVDDLANIVPAVMTMGLMGLPLSDWEMYCEPVHASVYTPPNTPEAFRVNAQMREANMHLYQCVQDIKKNPRPGLIDGLHNSTINGNPTTDIDVMGNCALLMGGGFDTTTALTAHSLEWLSEHPDQRARLTSDLDTLLDPATEEFLRYFTPAVGDGRTITKDCKIAGVDFKEGDRMWLSWAMANRSEDVFPNANEIDLERTGNRHASFGLGIHRCMGSNVARTLFKRMITQVLERIPDFVCEPSGADHYPTIGVINGMRKLPATFTPGERLGAGVAETVDRLQILVDEQRLAEPIGKRPARSRTS